MTHTQTFVLPKDGREAIAKRLHDFCLICLPGRSIKVTVEPNKSPRSSAQNRYLNGVAYALLSEATGYERDEISEYCNGTYHGWKTERCPKTPSNPKGVKDVPVRTSTTDAGGNRSVLTKLEFADYVAWVQRFGGTHGIHIPDPETDYAS